MPVVTVAGNPLFYQVHRGQGPAVVLIHGAGGTHLIWPSPLRYLPGATVYALDLPGHGRSQGAGRQHIKEYARDVVGFLDGVGVERAVLVGHSMGGAIAQTLAVTVPLRVLGLVLVATGARLRVAPAILEGLQSDLRTTVALIAQWAWGPGADPALVARGQRLMEMTQPRVLQGDFLACDQFDLRQEISQIAVPTLVLTGSEDRMTPPRFGQWLAEQIPGARFALIEEAGHMLMLERSDQVAGQIQRWLEDVTLSPQSPLE